MDQADLLLIVRREFCEEGPLLHPETKQKRFPHLHIFADYVDHFPAEEWYDRIVGPMLLQPKKLFLPMSVSLPRDESKLVVAYIDRQGSERFMPSAFHEWLLVQLLGNPDVHLLHLHMEDYTAEQQIYIASQADVMTGVHGNGLTHLLWMNPYAPTYIMEMFWETRFMLLFASLCRLKPQCRHRVIYGGVPFNTTTLNEELEWDIQSWFHPNYYTPEKFADWDEEGAKAYVNGIFQEALEAKRNRLHQK
uniref:Glycosyltransferase 61 catalytic domain-containing protein n=1 Tax=Pseudictyota dubia TaxID=2749911 RepID=A0A7R9W1M3_9STRA